MKILKAVWGLVGMSGLLVSLAACGTGAEPGGASGAASRHPSSENASAPSAAETTGEKQEGKTKVLVAYFSCTGHTKALAESIADHLDADLYEIVPADAYTDTDLDYGDDDSRTSLEQNDPSARPAISGTVENMEGYDTVFLGYPIWWGQAPKIISTFLENYSFDGKTIVPFCTSGSSGIGSSAENLHILVSENAVWLSGERLDSRTSAEELAAWIDGLGRI